MKPRIGIDVTPLPKKPVGAGQYIINLVNGILQSDSEFDYYIIAHEDDFPFFQLPEKFKEKFIFVSDHGRGIRILWEQFILPFVLLKNKIDLLHCLHYSRPIFSPCPVIVTIHDMTFFLIPEMHLWIKKIYFRFFIQYSAKNCPYVIAISESTKKDMVNILKIPSEKIVVTILGKSEDFKQIYDHEKFEQIKNKYKLPDQFILFVGLIEPRKNVGLLIQSYLDVVMNLDNNTDLVVAGRWGWESQKITELVESSDFSNRIHFPGYIDQNDLPILFNMAKIFIYPSNYEGFGLPVLEAMACGTPVITTNVSSMPEFVGDSGFLIEPENRNALSNAILTLINNETLQSSLSTKALAQSKKFTWNNTVKQTISLYKKLLLLGD